MKHLLIIAIFISACSEHKCPPPIQVLTKYDTVVRHLIDTLVILQTYDSVPEPNRDTTSRFGMIMISGGWESRPMELFKDGKRSDTIRRHTTIYVKQ